MVHHVKFLISSKNNIFSGTNPVKLPLNNVGNDCRIVRIVIKSASIPNVFYNVRDGINNKLYISYMFDGPPSYYLITIPEGQYTLTQLIDFLNAQPAFTIVNVSLSFNPLINKIITNNPGGTASFEYLATYPTNPSINKMISGCYELLGLLPGVNYSFPTGANTHPNICDLSGIKNIYVNCSFSKLNAIETKGYRDLGGIVPLDVPFGAVKTYLNQEQALDVIQRDPAYSQNLTDPEITLTDIEGNVLNTHGVHWEMCFKIYHAEGED